MSLSKLGARWIRGEPATRFDLARFLRDLNRPAKLLGEGEAEAERRYQEWFVPGVKGLPQPEALAAVREHFFATMIKQRIEDLESGRVQGISAEEALAELKAMLGNPDAEEIDDATDEEAERRYQAYLAGEMAAFPADEVIDEALARLRR